MVASEFEDKGVEHCDGAEGLSAQSIEKILTAELISTTLVKLSELRSLFEDRQPLKSTKFREMIFGIEPLINAVVQLEVPESLVDEEKESKLQLLLLSGQTFLCTIKTLKAFGGINKFLSQLGVRGEGYTELLRGSAMISVEMKKLMGLGVDIYYWSFLSSGSDAFALSAPKVEEVSAAAESDADSEQPVQMKLSERLHSLKDPVSRLEKMLASMELEDPEVDDLLKELALSFDEVVSLFPSDERERFSHELWKLKKATEVFKSILTTAEHVRELGSLVEQLDYPELTDAFSAFLVRSGTFLRNYSGFYVSIINKYAK